MNYNAIKMITDLYGYVLAIVTAGCVLTFIYFCLKNIVDDEKNYDKNLKRTLYILAISITIQGLIEIIKNYYL